MIVSQVGGCTSSSLAFDTATDTFASTTASTTLSVAYPSTVNSGDILVVAVYGPLATFTNDSGDFTLAGNGTSFKFLAGSAQASLFYKEADGTETGSEAFTSSVSTDWAMTMGRITGATQLDLGGSGFTANTDVTSSESVNVFGASGVCSIWVGAGSGWTDCTSLTKAAGGATTINSGSYGGQPYYYLWQYEVHDGDGVNLGDGFSHNSCYGAARSQVFNE